MRRPYAEGLPPGVDTPARRYLEWQLVNLVASGPIGSHIGAGAVRRAFPSCPRCLAQELYVGKENVV